jgi:hypothetical protein
MLWPSWPMSVGRCKIVAWWTTSPSSSSFLRSDCVIFISSDVVFVKRGDPGIEPGTSCTLNRNHTTRPIALTAPLPQRPFKAASICPPMLIDHCCRIIIQTTRWPTNPQPNSLLMCSFISGKLNLFSKSWCDTFDQSPGFLVRRISLM